MKNKIFPTPVSNLEPNSESCRFSEVSEGHDSSGERVTSGHSSPNKEVSFTAIMVRVLYYGLYEIVRGVLSNNGL